ncbi:amino acid adenylation domain-containing protein [Brevibacillus composti]|uniref:Amino acid adenylation domain-containing protein n=1 Tax=Brevibacillus composti TaxID=2796470 RepID=A0A7T5EHS6_9BACL|nr:non-ribosomal peptide synthetase [Brevibacillus composti]QQE72803.1 amino acid adenylation domain-containing protein [Brevibacillus composti]QUO39881.1 amino acid adenylation domain-containing protein [Brevibacillus composti]
MTSSGSMMKLSEKKRMLLERLLQEEGIEKANMAAGPIPSRENRNGIPLSYTQERLWFVHQLEPDNPVYNMPAALKFKGQLHLAALERSIHEIIRRHEALRTVFRVIDGQAVQVILPDLQLQLSVDKLHMLPAEKREEELQRLKREHARQSFPLDEGPLMRARLVQVEEQEYVLLLTIHHIIFDGWSIGVFVRELASLYESYAQEKEPALAPLPIQFGDFSLWQREQLEGEKLDKLLTYWRERLQGAPASLELPADRKRPPVQTFNGSTSTFTIPAALKKKVEELGQQEGATLFMTLLAAFNTLLYRYTGQTDLVLGTPIANRNRIETEALIGLFLNMLVLRTDLSGQPTFRQLLHRVKEVTLGAYEHQDLPFEKVVEALGQDHDLSRNPLFQILFVLQNAPVPALRLPGVELELQELETGTAKFDLSVWFTETDEGLAGTWEYNRDLFDPETIERMAAQFERLLASVTERPDQKVTELSILPDEEYRRVVYDWNDTETSYPQDVCIHQLFERQAEHRPDSTALLFEDRHVTYRELNEKANQFAHYLRKAGVGPNTRVGIMMQRSVEMIAGVLGVLKAGGAYVPLDPSYPAERQQYILENAEVKVLLTQGSAAEGRGWSESEKEVDSGEDRGCLVLEWERCGEHIRRESRENSEPAATPDDLAYIIYTSGSTGRPKGVVVRHKPVINLIDWVNNTFQVNPSDRMLWITSLGFDLSVYDIFGILAAGGSIRIVPDGDVREPERLLELLDSGEITFWDSAPAALQQVVPFLESGSRKPGESRLRLVFLSGDWIPVGMPDLLKKNFPLVEVVGLGGGTEATVWSNYYRIGEVPPEWISIPYGKPIQNAKYYILDPHGNPCPIGVPGELYIGGQCLAEGYANDPERTAERFIPDPFGKPGERMYRTGDLARFWPDGNMEFLGRVDNQVKIRGYRVELGEIETVVSQHPQVRNAVVIVFEEEPGDKRLVAYVVTHREETVAVPELRSFLRERLPEYMVPASFVFVPAIPVTTNGKVDRKALPKPVFSRSDLGLDYVPPRTPVEETLAAVWEAVLGQTPGIHDNFFEMGGDSILAIRVISLAKEKGLRFTPKDLFQHRTIAELVKVVRTAERLQHEQGIVEGPVPLTPIQHWFFEQEMTELHHFNHAVLLEEKEPLDLGLLEQAMQHLLRHHDALRLRFTRGEARWEQHNAGGGDEVSLERVDLSSRSAEEQAAAMADKLAEWQASMNLSEGPIIRMGHFSFGEEKTGRIFLAIHHLAVDGVSWRILLEDLDTAYQQLKNGESIRLSQKTTSFQHWAHRLVDFARTGRVQQEIDYWLTALPEQATKIPVDCETGENAVDSAETVTVGLEADETTQLLTEVPKAYRTQINEVLLAALVRSFARWTGSDELLIDLEGHGRDPFAEDLDLSRTVGWFTSLYPLHVKASAAHGPGLLLKAVKEQMRGVPNNGMRYGLLRYLSGDDAGQALRKLPRAEISFNYLGQYDETLTRLKTFTLAEECSGPDRSPRATRPYLIEISGKIMRGRLHLEWNYSRNVHDRSTITRLAHDYMASLREIIAHCTSPQAGGFTPSDFPAAKISSGELSKLLLRVQKEMGGRNHVDNR